MKKAITSLSSFLLLAFGGVAQTNVQQSPADLNIQIDNIIRPLAETGDFNGNVLVVKGGNKVYEKSFGFTDGSKQHRLSPASKFNVGSIYKELPAISILQLREKGLLKLDDKITAHLSGLPKWAEDVTIKNLLQYTAGLPRINWGKYQVISDEILMNSLLGIKELEYEPGTDYIYTNYCPFLLSKIVEEISNQAFPEYADKHIFMPAGMVNSTFKLSMPYKDRTDMAVPFNNNYEEDAPPFQINLPLLLFSTTASDLYKLNQALHDFTLVSENSVIQIAKASELEGGNKQSPLGNAIIENNKVVFHQHHGSSGNYESLLHRDIAKDLTIIMMTNRKKGNLHETVSKIDDLLSD